MGQAEVNHFSCGFEPVQIGVKQGGYRAYFVNQGKSGAGYANTFRQSQGATDAAHEKCLARPEFAAQDHQISRTDAPG